MQLTNHEAELVYQDRRPHAEISKQYGITPNQVSRIKRGRSRANLMLKERFGEPGSGGFRKLTPAEIEAIYLSTETNEAISALFGLKSSSSVSNIKNGFTHKNLKLRAKHGPAPGTHDFMKENRK